MLFLALAFINVNAENGWKLVKDKNDIQLYKRPHPGSKIHEWQASTIGSNPFEVSLEVMKDHDAYKEWYGMCKDLYVIKKYSNTHFDMYFILDLPVIANRDLVVEIKTKTDLEKGIAVVTINAKKSDYGKNSGLKRMHAMIGTFTMTRMGPDKTKVDYQLFADIGGSVPSWMVNTSSAKHPFDTILGVRNQAKKKIYFERASK